MTDVTSFPPDGAEPVHICDCAADLLSPESFEEAVANATLIAAARDMRAALESIRGRLHAMRRAAARPGCTATPARFLANWLSDDAGVSEAIEKATVKTCRDCGALILSGDLCAPCIDDARLEPMVDDSVKHCPDCETPNQFGEVCPACQRDRELEAIENR